MPHSKKHKKIELVGSELDIFLTTETGVFSWFKGKNIRFDPKVLSEIKKIDEPKVNLVDFHLEMVKKIDALIAVHEKEIEFELVHSRKTIEDHLGDNVEFLSAPHGMIDKRVIDIARSVGYKAICTSEPGFNHRLNNPAILKRINISDGCNLQRFKKILEADQKMLLPEIVSKKIICSQIFKLF